MVDGLYFVRMGSQSENLCGGQGIPMLSLIDSFFF